jgi:hypothetical protein
MERDYRLFTDKFLVLFGVLIAVGWYILAYLPCGIGKEQAAGLAGALFGGAALLLGNWINRLNDRAKTNQEQTVQVKKLKALIAAELVNVAVDLMSAKQFVDAALITQHAGGLVPDSLDMSQYQLRQMSFTDGLGTHLLALEQDAIDAIVTLRSDLAITQKCMSEVTAGARFGLMTATSLSNGLGNNMLILREVFSHIEPIRKLHLPNAEPELVTAILTRLAKPAVASVHQPGQRGYK